MGLATIFSDHRQFDALFVVLPVLAQSTEADTTARPKADSTTIVATSSRLASWGYKALSPVSVLDSAKFKLSGIQAIENTLNKSPQFTPDDYDSSDNGLNKGVAVVNMRQLGEKHSPPLSMATVNTVTGTDNLTNLTQSRPQTMELPSMENIAFEK